MYLGVLLGGISREREISIRSGKRIAQALRNMGHVVDEIDVDDNFIYKLSELKKYDALFNILHGTFGEDGKMQAILDSIGIPYTGSGVETSVIAFDKYLCNLFVENTIERYEELSVVKIPNFLLISSEEFEESKIYMIEEKIGLPCVVKPRKEGSSIGTHICFSKEELLYALKNEFKNYDEMIVQEYIKGKEITVSVIDINGTPTVLPILELRPKKLFYDYEAKYTDGMTEFIIPAELDGETTEKINHAVLKIYKSLGCKHFSRIDGIVKDGVFYFLEVNTLPGMTELSDLPMSANAFGISFDELVDLIIKEACRKL
ncbi:D-alanyl-alanine synthetase A [Fervidobacterium sp. SC_NGM5_G05]|nr:D-alanyl-alanine synthetase A [Fervidobacterium sp. SC_NGM5_G05]